VATWIDTEACIGCSWCNPLCPWEALEVSTDFVNQVDEEKCVRCLICVNVCPLDAIRVPPCMVACPIHMDIPGYLSLCGDGKFVEGYNLMRRTNALPAVLGHICYHPCEDACRSNYVDEAIAICAVKRFLSDQVDVDKLKVPRVVKRGKNVAIVGAGPAGLAAANELILLGYDVMMFEASPEPGGLLRYGIPEYRLPKGILDKDIGYIQRLGVEIKTNTKVGKEVTLEELRRKFKAVFIATGAQESLRLGITGEDTPGVMTGVSFLRAINTGQSVDIKGKVLVIGGGNVAVDAARVALRKGAQQVTIVYRREKQDMPAIKDEIKAVEEEGIDLQFLAAPTKVIAQNGKVSGIECVKMKLGALDKSGRKTPSPIEGSQYVINADKVVVAVGQAPSLAPLGTDLTVNPRTLTTNLPGVYAGGDLVSRPSRAVEAMATGKKAARYMHRYLHNKIEWLELVRQDLEKFSREEYRSRIPVEQRYSIPREAAKKRVKDFREVERTYSESDARAEARRCVGRRICSEYKKP